MTEENYRGMDNLVEERDGENKENSCVALDVHLRFYYDTFATRNDKNYIFPNVSKDSNSSSSLTSRMYFLFHGKWEEILSCRL